LYHHHHARAATVGPIINGPVFIGGEVAGVEAVQLQVPSRQRSTKHAVLRHRIEHFRQQRDNA
jgi:hypothetical protein